MEDLNQLRPEQESLDALVQVVGGAGKALKNVQGIRNFAQAPVPLPQAVQDPVSQAAAIAVPVVRKSVQARHERLGHFLQKALIDLLLDGGDTLVGDFLLTLLRFLPSFFLPLLWLLRQQPPFLRLLSF